MRQCASPVLNEWTPSRHGQKTHDHKQSRKDGSSDPRCRRSAQHLLRGKWFCEQHLPIWRTHYEIVDRILSIPARSPDIL